MYPGWSPRGNQRWTALFHSFDVFLCWFREHDKHQRWSALFQSWWALNFFWISAVQNWKNQRCFRAEQRCFREKQLWIALFSTDFLCSETLDFQRWFSTDLLWISSDIYTCGWDYQNICFVTWAVTVNPKIQVCVISLACTKMEKSIFVAHFFFVNSAENQSYVPRNWGT